MTNQLRDVERLERLQNSRDGNPRFRVHFVEGASAITAADHSFVFGLSDDLHGPVRIAFTRTGEICGLTPV